MSHRVQRPPPVGGFETFRDGVASWVVALKGRAAGVTHALNGHTVEWNRTPSDASCPGDIVCNDCSQVLWCRAYDPWRARASDTVVDHWGGTRPLSRPLLDVLGHVLQLAEQCPRGPAGYDVRRMACRLIEAVSVRENHLLRRRMLATLNRLKRMRLVTVTERTTVQQLTDIVQNELPEAATTEGRRRELCRPPGRPQG
jgi:hypothetical protein